MSHVNQIQGIRNGRLLARGERTWARGVLFSHGGAGGGHDTPRRESGRGAFDEISPFHKLPFPIEFRKTDDAYK